MNPFVKWLMSPLAEWHVATLQHKLFVGSAGAAMFWYLHKYKSSWPLWQRALASLGSAYGVSMLLHSLRRYDQGPAVLPVMAPAAPAAPTAPPVGAPMDMPKKAEVYAAPFDTGKAANMKLDLEEAETDGMSGDEGIFG